MTVEVKEIGMSGLDKIIADIRSESDMAVASVTSAAQEQRQRDLDAARKEADSRSQKILSRAKKQASEMEERASSSAMLQRRRAILEARQEIIASVIAEARKELEELPDDRYFDLILGLIGKNAMEGEGEVCFCRRDFDRLPKDFAYRLVAALPDGAKLDVSREDVMITGGIILKYGGIEQNLSIEEIFEENKDRMVDIARKVLFSGSSTGNDCRADFEEKDASASDSSGCCPEEEVPNKRNEGTSSGALAEGRGQAGERKSDCSKGTDGGQDKST